MITLSTAHAAERAAAAIAATLAKLNSGVLGAIIPLYDTVRPANGAAESATPLAVITLDKPAGTITDGVLTLTLPPDVLIDVTGIAVWARIIVDSGIVLDCDVTDVAGTGMIKLASTQLYAGGTVRLASGVLS